MNFIPDVKKHFYVSMIKSGIRIVGYLTILFALKFAVALLIISEVIGIVEELV